MRREATKRRSDEATKGSKPPLASVGPSERGAGATRFIRSLTLAALIKTPGAGPVTRPVRKLPLAALINRSMTVAVLIALCTASALAQSGGGYVIKKSTIDSGGHSNLTGGGYKLGGTVGQHDAGNPTGGGYKLTGGF